MIKARDPITGKPFYSLLNTKSVGKAVVSTILGQFERNRLPTELADKYVNETAKLAGTPVNKGDWSPPALIS